MTPSSPDASTGPIHVAAAGIQARLLAVFPANRFQHELLPAPMSVKTLAALSSARAPVIGLAFLGFRPGPGSGRTLAGRLRFGVYLITSNPKSAARLLGDRLSPGLAQMVHVAILGLNGWTLSGERDGAVGTIELREIENTEGAEWQADNCACAAITAELPASFTGIPPDQLNTIVSNWTFDGTTDVAVDQWQRPA